MISPQVKTLATELNSQFDAPGEDVASGTLQNGHICTNEHEKGGKVIKAVVNPKVLESERELKRLLQSRCDKSDVPMDFAAKRHLIFCDGPNLKFIEMSGKLQESLKCNKVEDLISHECFDKVSIADFLSPPHTHSIICTDS